MSLTPPTDDTGAITTSTTDGTGVITPSASTPPITGYVPSSINIDDPFLLTPTDYAVNKLISLTLTGDDNYHIWSCTILTALEARNKHKLVDGSLIVDNPDDTRYSSWKRCNSLVLWYASSNDTRVYKLRQALSATHQGSMNLWYLSCSLTTPGEDKYYVFLMGLGECFSAKHSHILSLDPLQGSLQLYPCGATFPSSNLPQSSLQMPPELCNQLMNFLKLTSNVSQQNDTSISNISSSSNFHVQTPLPTVSTVAGKIFSTLPILFVLTLPTLTVIPWIIDSGDSDHVVSSPAYLRSVKPLHNSYVTLPNGEKQVTTHIGLSHLEEDWNGNMHRGLYFLKTPTPTINSVLSLPKPPDSMLLHHPKMKHQPFSLSVTQSVSIFELMHVDIWGPHSLTSIDGYKYFLTIVDDFSRTTWIYLMHTKTETRFFIQQFCNYVETHSDTKRKHQHIINTARALRFHAHLPETFWSFCTIAAVYLINRLPSHTLDKYSPNQILFNKPQDYANLRVFGCLCYSVVTSPKRSKLSPRARAYIFLGYPLGVKGYKVFDLETHDIFISRGVQFHEHIFSFHMPPSTSSSPNSPPDDVVHDILPLLMHDHPLPQHLPSPTSVATPTPSPNASASYSDLSLCTSFSTPPPIRHSLRHTHPPSYLQDYHYNSVICISSSSFKGRPAHFAEAVKGLVWHKAMNLEFHKAIGFKWVYKIKYNPDDTLERHKTHLVAQGFIQKPGFDYNQNQW
ncbi:uncharacterized protein LOC119979866 [Tripterygium wilfordii]|uniref:uncharacterized protein LOC119979866 n=1 Tax=Tripterygium wilfordii TaxID=458696 RepID=UPI0018F7EF90|nr:uncharacterized protein LOC119979866 [Tripterygium wilfordii]